MIARYHRDVFFASCSGVTQVIYQNRENQIISFNLIIRMKKITFFVVAALIGISSFAQLSVGIQATGNLASGNIKAAYSDFDLKKGTEVKPGAGIVAELGIGHHFGVRAGANYLQQGGKFTSTADDASVSAKMSNSLNYVQVPVHVIYGVKLAGFRVFGGLGGYAAYGVSGKSKSTVRYNADGSPIEYTDEAKAFDKEDDGGANLRRTDFGASAIAGIELPGGLFAHVGYQLGLSNISRDEDTKYRNRGAQLTIGYYLFR